MQLLPSLSFDPSVVAPFLDVVRPRNFLNNLPPHAVAANDELLPAVDPHLLPSTGPQACLITAVETFGDEAPSPWAKRILNDVYIACNAQIYSGVGGFMARGKKKGNAAVNRAAEVVGHALGSVAGTIDSLQAQHPHPVEEAREALAAGQETLSAVASRVGTRAAAMIKKAKAGARQTKNVATRARRKRTRAITRLTGSARKVVNRAKKHVNRRQKTTRRAAGRLKR